MKTFLFLLSFQVFAQTAPAPPSAHVPPVGAPAAEPAPTVPPPAPATPREAWQAALEKQKASSARQLESVRKQAQNVGVWMMPGAPLPVPPVEPVFEATCDPVPEVAATALIEGAAKAQDVQPKLLRAVIEQESGFRPCAVSAKGARGLMQLMPETALELGVADPFDPKENVEAGAKYLKQLLDRYKGDLSQALGAYNSGPSTVDQAGGVPNIQETRSYVDAILKRMEATRPNPAAVVPPN